MGYKLTDFSLQNLVYVLLLYGKKTGLTLFQFLTNSQYFFDNIEAASVNQFTSIFQ